MVHFPSVNYWLSTIISQISQRTSMRLKTTHREVNIVWGVQPQEELPRHPGEVSGHDEGVGSLGELGLQGDSSVVGVGHPAHQLAGNTSPLHRLPDPLVQPEESESNGEEGVNDTQFVAQLPAPLLHQGDVHLRRGTRF